MPSQKAFSMLRSWNFTFRVILLIIVVSYCIETQKVYFSVVSAAGASPATPFINGTYPMPPEDKDYDNNDLAKPLQDGYRLSDVVRSDYLHAPLYYSLALQAMVGLRLNSFSNSDVEVGPHERKYLRRYRQQRKEDPNSLQSEKNSKKPLQRPYEILYDQVLRGDDNRAPEQSDKTILREGFLRPITDLNFQKNIIPTQFRRAFCDYFVELMQVPPSLQPDGNTTKLPALVIDVFDLHVAQFTLYCLYFKSHALKNATRRFVLLTLEEDNTPGVTFFNGPAAQALRQYPDVHLRYLLNHPLLAHWYGVNGNIFHEKFSAIPIGVSFYHRSGRHSLLPWQQDGQGYPGKEKVHTRIAEVLLQHLDLQKVFPHIRHPLRWGSHGCIWLEKALELFGDGSRPHSSYKNCRGCSRVEKDMSNFRWIPLEQLPQRVTTIYVVLMPMEWGTAPRRRRRPSLTSEVLIFTPPEGSDKHEDLWGDGVHWSNTVASRVALLPFTAALYHKLLQRPFGNPERVSRVVASFQIYPWRAPILNYFESHSTLAAFPKSSSQEKYYAYLNQYAFAMSPVGYGYECYRTMEALIMGAIPILQRPSTNINNMNGNSYRNPIASPQELKYVPEINPDALVSELYSDLPVVLVDKVEDITQSALNRWAQEILSKMKQGKYNLEKLFMQYWLDRVYSHY